MSENISDQNGIFLPYDQYGRLCYALSHAKTTMYDETHTVYDIINILASGADPGSTQVISINGKNGEVNLTAEDIVAQIISNDSDSPTKWENVEVIQNNETSKSIFTKLSTMFKNIRYMWKLIGNTDISKINGGTITGNIYNMSNRLKNIEFCSLRYNKELVVSASSTIEIRSNSYDEFETKSTNLLTITNHDSIDRNYQWVCYIKEVNLNTGLILESYEIDDSTGSILIKVRIRNITDNTIQIPLNTQIIKLDLKYTPV